MACNKVVWWTSIYYFVAYGGLLAFMIPGAIYSIQALLSTRTTDVQTYNTAVETWTNAEYASFQGKAVSFSTDAVSSLSLPAVHTTDPATVARASDIWTYNEYARYFGQGSQVVFENVTNYDGASIVSRNLYVSVNGVTSSVSVPVLFPFTYTVSCYGQDNCPCADGSASSNSECKVWATLAGACLVVDADGRLASSSEYGAGCYPVSKAGKTPLGIPQSDTCVPMNVNNISPFTYSLSSAQPTAVNFQNYLVTVRSIYDPYVAALSLTRGSLNFGTPIVTLITISGAMWACFSICVAMVVLMLLCVHTGISDGMKQRFVRPIPRRTAGDHPVALNPLNNANNDIVYNNNEAYLNDMPHANANAGGQDVGDWMPGHTRNFLLRVVAAPFRCFHSITECHRSNGCSCCVPAEAGSRRLKCKWLPWVLYGLVLVGSFITYLALGAYYSANAQLACAYKQVCGDHTVFLKCSTMGELADGSSEGSAFRSIQIASLVATGLVLAVLGGLGYVGGGSGCGGCAVVVGVLCGTLLMVGSILQIVAQIIFSLHTQTIVDGFCNMLQKGPSALYPSYCKVNFTDAALLYCTTAMGLTFLLSMCTGLALLARKGR